MNEQEIARRRHEYMASQVTRQQADLIDEPSRVQAIADRRGSYVTTIPCEYGHQHRRFTNSTSCCSCYDEWKRQKAIAATINHLSDHLQQEPATYTRKGIGGLQPQTIPKH